MYASMKKPRLKSLEPGIAGKVGAESKLLLPSTSNLKGNHRDCYLKGWLLPVVAPMFVTRLAFVEFFILKI